MEMDNILCTVSADFPIGHRVAFECFWNGAERSVMAFRDQSGQWIACVNRCPHWAEALDSSSSVIYASNREHIVCSIHLAEFRTCDGVCTSGPCLGARLQMIPVQWHDGGLWLMDHIPLTSI